MLHIWIDGPDEGEDGACKALGEQAELHFFGDFPTEVGVEDLLLEEKEGGKEGGREGGRG